MVEIGQNQISNLIFTPNSWSYECYTFFGKVLIHPHVCVCVRSAVEAVEGETSGSRGCQVCFVLSIQAGGRRDADERPI
jgi:hypothetical protein